MFFYQLSGHPLSSSSKRNMELQITCGLECLILHQCLGIGAVYYSYRVDKYAKFGVFYTKIVQMTPQGLPRESLRLQKFSVTNTVLSFPYSQQIQFTLIVNVVNHN